MMQSLWHRTLILAAVTSIAVSVATRYSTIVPLKAEATKRATSQSLDGKRQHLLNDGLHWSAPAVKSVLFVPARLSAAVLPFIGFVTGLHSEELYDRPPPYC